MSEQSPDSLSAGESVSGAPSVDARLARARQVLAEAEAIASTSAAGEATPRRSSTPRRATRSSNTGRGSGASGRSVSNPSASSTPWASNVAEPPPWASLMSEAPGDGVSGNASVSGNVSVSRSSEAPAGAVARVRRASGPAETEPTDRDAEHEARQVVLRQLAMAPRSRAQLTDKLASKGVPPEVAEAVLDRFTEVGLIDDEANAEMLVRSRHESRGLSRRGLRHELRKKGIDSDIAEEALSAVDVESERARAEELVAGRLKRLHGLSREVQTRRLAGFLARKGYPGDLAYSVIREALDQASEHRRD